MTKFIMEILIYTLGFFTVVPAILAVVLMNLGASPEMVPFVILAMPLVAFPAAVYYHVSFHTFKFAIAYSAFVCSNKIQDYVNRDQRVLTYKPVQSYS
jgi:hypothetical protein